MLHTEILETKTLELLTQLMHCDQIKDFCLVGGTALSLYLGHRKSIDLDLFCKQEFNVQELRHFLTETFHFQERYTAGQTLKGDINGVFIDLLRHDYPDIQPATDHNGIRIASAPDIIAMKLSAITDNGTREKDFVDIAFFSTRYSMNQMLQFYTAKYQGSNTLTTLKALLYFDDLQRHEPVNLLAGEYDWSAIEQRLKQMVNHPDKTWPDFPHA